MRHLLAALATSRALRLSVPLLSILALSSCNPAYQKPTAPDGTANVRFTTPQSKGWTSGLNAYVHDNGEKCGTPKKIFSMGGGMFNFGGGKKSDADIGMFKDPKRSYVAGQYYETRIAAGRRFNFTVAGGEHQGTCTLSGSFDPVAGGSYELTYRTTQSMCYLNIDRIYEEDGRFLRVKEITMSMRPRACTNFWN